MDKKTEALKLALDALEKCDGALAEELAAWDIDPPLHHVLEASNACGPSITAIKEALAQPQRTWVGLTNDEIVDAYDVAIVSFKRSQQGIRGQMLTYLDSIDWHYAKAIEAALREKNT